ncbi:MAG TPA: metallophosphoesterase [Phycisphaerae bacterium]|nr:metallophosphoesterase [Phycisphaerae bacterium]HRY69602.1 metallophosphoesterase [Phycisphaerae bacterium]HSA27283.1 metallophosphoesterase [Phycisphaerae bacterium]
MRIVATADLHYDITRSREPTRLIAEEICGLEADALLVLGDVAGRDSGIVLEALRLFDRFRGRKFFVAGNHDIWTGPGGDSLDKLERELPAICRQAGFHPLDVEPAVLGHVGLVGSIGWYDFSYRPRQLGIPLRFYEAKIAPGAADRLPGFQHLLADRSDVPEAAFSIGTRWMDGEHTRLKMSDVEFCQRLVDRLSRHLTEVAGQCDPIVVGMHHVPFAELVPATDTPSWAFAGAFLGSDRFGRALLGQPEVRMLVCGHSHRLDRLRCGHIQCINVGCTYLAKRYEVLDL